MPVRQGYETIKGKKTGYYRWGREHKYHYKPGNEASRSRARNLAEKQARAIYASGYRGKK